jgi:hypothetical protein
VSAISVLEVQLGLLKIIVEALPAETWPCTAALLPDAVFVAVTAVPLSGLVGTTPGEWKTTAFPFLSLVMFT